jgi:hypothetical protein
MGVFLLFALMLFLLMLHRHLKKRPSAPAAFGSAGRHALQELPKLFSLGGLMVSLVLSNFLIHYLTRDINVWPWPIQPVLSLGDAYGRIFYYLPMMLIPAYCLYWLKKSNITPRPWFAKQGSEGLAHKIVTKNIILTACSIDFGLTTAGLVGILPAKMEF